MGSEQTTGSVFRSSALISRADGHAVCCHIKGETDYEKQKSYPTFANLDKIAEYFNATPTQLFGTSKEIELEKSVLESNEYSDKVSEILKAVKYIEDFLETDGQYLEDLLYLILIWINKKEIIFYKTAIFLLLFLNQVKVNRSITNKITTYISFDEYFLINECE